MNLGSDSYDIIIENNALDKLASYLKEVYTKKKVYIISDSNVWNIYQNKIKESLSDYLIKEVIINPGETSKSFSTYTNVLERLIDLDIRREELLIAFGGGVVGDLTGFIAATLYRGLPFIQIPTSLLSQMDSSIGGKTGIDFYNRKNIVGAFKQPKLVIIDPNTLKTLPNEEIISGMGELIKHALIGNLELFNKLLTKLPISEDIIFESLTVKKRIVELDPFDLKERMYLNFGHTFGHLIELERNYSHGYAVILGMIMAIKLGIDLKITKPIILEQLLNLLANYQIKYEVIDYKPYLKDIIYDKKNLAGKVRFILIKDIGQVVTYLFDEEELKNGCNN